MPVIDSVHFQNFKVLRDATLPLGRVTVLVGPNGSGKSTALEGLQLAAHRSAMPMWMPSLASGCNGQPPVIAIDVQWNAPVAVRMRVQWTSAARNPSMEFLPALTQDRQRSLLSELSGIRVYCFTGSSLSGNAALQPGIEMTSSGGNLAAALDQLRDSAPERFEALNAELNQWLPEFDRILFQTPGPGSRAIRLRIARSNSVVDASNLSEGTLFALALLTLAHLPEPPPILALEEPDRAIHPRLLGEVRDAIYRLAYPESVNDQRKPVQVIATTHSPYFLSLFRDHPEEVVIAEKQGLEATFHRLSNRADLDEILQDAPLGDIWYSGILGGVPARP